MITYFFNIFYNTFFSNADLILPNLWLGSFRSALDTKFLKDNQINVIINCTENIPFIDQLDNTVNYEHIEFIRIPVNDSLLEKDLLLMQDYFKIILPFLYKKYVNEKKNILIHCREGKQRSAIITAAFLKILIDSQKIDIIKPESNMTSQFNSIVNYILNKRPQAFTYGFRINFKKTYKRYFYQN